VKAHAAPEFETTKRFERKFNEKKDKKKRGQSTIKKDMKSISTHQRRFGTLA
jgi:hypothetical protein